MQHISTRQPEQYYAAELKRVRVDLTKLKKVSLRFSVLRLVIFILTIAFSILLFSHNTWIALTALIGGISLFLSFVKKHQFVELELLKHENKKAIIENEISVIEKFENSNYNGSKFVNDNHNYSSDLDIFGSNSLFGLINRCRSFHGLEILANYFSLTPALSEIRLREAAILELEKEPQWRLDFLTALYSIKDGPLINEGEIIKGLLSEELSFSSKKLISGYRRALPAFWLLFGVLYYFGFAENLLFLPVLIAIINFRISAVHARKVGVIQDNLSKVGSKLGIYKNAMSAIYSREWNSNLIKDKIKNSEFKPYISRLERLEKLSSLLDYRLNVAVSIFLNLGLLWDSKIISKLEKWGETNKGIIDDVLGIVGSVESVVSFAAWNYNNPENVNAEITESYFELEGKAMVHPLLTNAKAVSNDFSVIKGNFISIITGSNMSGKSTFLRTLGTNMVLGNCGAKVCGSELKYSLVSIVTYMRIKDALEEDVSTFKAELIRVEKILDLMEASTPVFILADEMLRGTNSNDKLLGSQAIIKKIAEQEVYGVIATHDLDLTEVKVPGIKNYYFDISFENDDLIFDYKIREGICQSFNASFLLRQLGLEVESK